MLENFDDEELKNIGNICKQVLYCSLLLCSVMYYIVLHCTVLYFTVLYCKQVFLVFPHYCLGRGLIDMATESGLNAVIGQFGEWALVARWW